MFYLNVKAEELDYDLIIKKVRTFNAHLRSLLE